MCVGTQGGVARCVWGHREEHPSNGAKVGTPKVSRKFEVPQNLRNLKFALDLHQTAIFTKSEFLCRPNAFLRLGRLP